MWAFTPTQSLVEKFRQGFIWSTLADYLNTSLLEDLYPVEDHGKRPREHDKPWIKQKCPMCPNDIDQTSKTSPPWSPLLRTHMKLVVTRRNGFATSERLFKLLNACRRVTPVVCCSLRDICEELGGTKRNWEEMRGAGRNWEELGGTERNWEDLSSKEKIIGQTW